MTASGPGLERSGITAPRVSVIIPCYRAAHFVADAITSVLDQEHEEVEILVVDDGSPDREALVEAIHPFGDAVKLVDGPHEGLAAARNRGIAAARGGYLAFLDADDCWKPGFLARQIELLERDAADLVYCDAEFFGPKAIRGRTVMHGHPSQGEVTVAAVLAGRCTVVMSTILARAEPVREAGGFDPELRLCEDVDLWVRLLLAGARLRYHRDALALRRMHDANISRDGEGMLRGALAVVERYRREAGLDDAERAGVERRIRDLHVSLHLLSAKKAIVAGHPATARRRLWDAFRETGAWKPLIAALSLAVAPGPTMRFLRSRQETEESGL